jgi:hypothetical protein
VVGLADGTLRYFQKRRYRTTAPTYVELTRPPPIRSRFDVGDQARPSLRPMWMATATLDAVVGAEPTARLNISRTLLQRGAGLRRAHTGAANPFDGV